MGRVGPGHVAVAQARRDGEAMGFSLSLLVVHVNGLGTRVDQAGSKEKAVYRNGLYALDLQYLRQVLYTVAFRLTDG